MPERQLLPACYSKKFVWGLSGGGFDQKGQIGGEQFDRNGQQDNAKEFLEDVNNSGSQNFFKLFGHFENQINHNHITEYGQQNINVIKLGADGEQGCQSAGSGQQRKNNRYKSGVFGGIGLVFEDFNIQNHFHGNDEDNQRAGNGKRRDVYVEQVKKSFSAVEKYQKDNQRQNAGFGGVNPFAALFEV